MNAFASQTVINPYLGPRPFQAGERLYGRQAETVDLTNRLFAQRLVLLFSPSGAGNTSLIRAGIIPQMKERGFLVLPVVRLYRPAEAMPGEPANRFVLSALMSLEEEQPIEQQVSIKDLVRLTLADYFSKRLSSDQNENVMERQRILCVFDQFEEILLIDPHARMEKEGFFAQLMEVLLDDRVWALFAMREDYVAGLEPYLIYFPERLSRRYRLDRLSRESAVEALVRPAQDAGVDFEAEAAQKIVEDLSRVLVQDADGSIKYTFGNSVEPLQLQIVGRSLWESARLDPSRISLTDVEHIGDIDEALSHYYDTTIQQAAMRSGTNERQLRAWIEQALITPKGMRNQILAGDEVRYEINRSAVDSLVGSYLIRVERRQGSTWYELANDRLIDAIRQSNGIWFETNLSVVQRQAELWERESRTDQLLLRGSDLAEAENWASANRDQVNQIELEFLTASRVREAEAVQAENLQAETLRSRRTIRLLIIALIAVVLLAIAGWAYAFWPVN